MIYILIFPFPLHSNRTFSGLSGIISNLLRKIGRVGLKGADCAVFQLPALIAKHSAPFDQSFFGDISIEPSFSQYLYLYTQLKAVPAVFSLQSLSELNRLSSAT